MKSLSKINVNNHGVLTGIAAFLFLGSVMSCAQSKATANFRPSIRAGCRFPAG